ncbi:DUF1559 family PulG-like putative transporter [Blastopirellula retiformator]|uniref:DUF1559 domain-containing protein n=1 Tax=Blastopirellula retiformator TaxID=2527970 RepID=A0A5C5V486_9BACT|nr:DUF1559 domain-containing protein [Blastopirellula retiformator]TWT33364.1 hypothetical protein Enr8_31910 [Blastopirellula retiformator]
MSRLVSSRLVRRSGKSALPVVIIVLVVVLVVLLMCGGVLVALLLPAVQQARAAARRMSSMNNMKQIGLALHNYHDTYGTLPASAINDKNGEPMHSWRVLILPFLGYPQIYSQYDFNEPWDSPSNRLLLSQIPDVYIDPTVESPGEGGTSYQAVISDATAMNPERGSKFREVTDGISNTILVVENTGVMVPWLQPSDTSVEDFAQGIPFKHGLVGGTQVLLGDGAVRFMGETTDPETLKGMSTRDGREAVGAY